MRIENCSNLQFYGIKVTAVFNFHSVSSNKDFGAKKSFGDNY